MNKKQPTHPVPANDSFEYHLKQLEQIVQQLEAGQLDLAQSLTTFETGVEHLRICHERLRQAELRISQVVDVAEDGTARLKEFGGEGKADADPPRKSPKKQPTDPDRLF
jgi:exodeoxyribonuclease VII small subunit